VDPGDELVDVVDDDDRVVRVLPRRRMRAGHLLHRCSYVLVRRCDGLIHVHRRTETKDSEPGAYDMLPGGVCATGESYELCARRELAEELGIEDVAPVFVFKHRYDGPQGHVIGSLYEVTWDGDIREQPEEIAWSTWVTPADLDRMLAELPFCADSREIYERWRADTLAR
jgi:ADP-ribose pyrophosphatase YjhB (NUDIX family)